MQDFSISNTYNDLFRRIICIFNVIMALKHLSKVKLLQLVHTLDIMRRKVQLVRIC